MEISVIPCMGKNNLDRPTAIFSEFQIPTYVVWDSDHGDKNTKPEHNHRLLRLVGAPIEDWPERVSDNHACFRQNLEHTLRAELGEDFFDDVLEQCCSAMGFARPRDAIKCPGVIQHIIEEGRMQGKVSSTLEAIVDHITAL